MDTVRFRRKKVRAIRPPSKDTVTKKASDPLTPEEITQIIHACKKSVDRALIMLLYEGGFRIGEVAQMTWEDLSFNNGGVATSIKFKTAFARHIRAHMCTQYLLNWRADYPGIPEGSAREAIPVFSYFKRPFICIKIIC